ncbi:hypothetical protein [Lignipirellula cremea]|uniref:Uncharacterized protein n=1 Tax=Lignipirellula cremea TaxID=2528010 RepID=A0A518DSW8_9BACT|nr:hypothetical protein [Lignipirellula cremea]QDU94927.1 hypothetical protein Pla8534_27350 [Lignipirellula cremea]
MRKALVLAGAAVLTLCAMLPTAGRAETVWRTTYRSLGGDIFDAKVVINTNGSTGYYDTYDNNGNVIGGGELYNIKYQNLGQQPILRGNWSWKAGGSGNFAWKLNPTLDQYEGNYSATSGGGGFWDGELTGGSGGAAGQGGPFIKK